MTLKLSNIQTFFFTYLCPRFYAGSPGVPSNTTSTQTVNQSPWQNPVYQALMLGTKEEPGPVTSMLNNNKALMAQYNAINANGLPAAQQASLGTWNSAASPTANIVNQLDPVTGRYTAMANPALWKTGVAPGEYTAVPRPTLTPAQKVTGPAGSLQWNPETQGALYMPEATTSDATQAAARGGIMGLKGYARGSTATTSTANFLSQDIQRSLGRPASQADLDFWTPRIDNGSISRDQFTAQTKASPEGVQYAKDNPEAVAMNNMSPSDKADALKKQHDAGKALTADQTSFLQNYTDSSSNIWKGDIDPITGLETPTARGVNQSSAEYTKYLKGVQDAGGTVPTEDATQYGITAKSNAPYTLTDTLKKTAYYDPITGQTTNPGFLQLQKEAAGLKTPKIMQDAGIGLYQGYEATKALQNYKPSDVNATMANVASMNAPSDISAKMAVVDRMQGADNISANQLQQYQMRGPQAITGPTTAASQMQGPQSWLDQGTAQAYMNPYTQSVVDIQKREANRDYQQQLNQLNAESVKAGAFGGSRQAIQQAEAARNQATRLGDIEAQGLNQAYAQGAQQFNTAQGQGLQAGQANLSASQQTSLANQATQIQAMMANQGMDFNTALQNLQAKLGVQNTQSASDLQAAMSNQNVQQQTQAANMAAQNAANNAYAQQQLVAAQTNYGGKLTAAQANQQASNAANNAYAQNALTASQANQGAGLQANQQNLGAANQMAGIANQGIGAGSAMNAVNAANMGIQGQVATATQNLQQQYLDTQSGNAQSWLNAPNTIAGPVSNVINAQDTTGGTNTITGTTAPASWGARGGLIKNGKVSKRGNV